MKFLIDASLSPRLAAGLRSVGHDAIHVRDVGPLSAPDEQVLERARREDRVLVAADSDFGTILASTHATRPSVLYVRGTRGRRVEAVLSRITDALPTIDAPLSEGSLVVLEPSLVRIRALPLL